MPYDIQLVDISRMCVKPRHLRTMPEIRATGTNASGICAVQSWATLREESLMCHKKPFSVWRAHQTRQVLVPPQAQLVLGTDTQMKSRLLMPFAREQSFSLPVT